MEEGDRWDMEQDGGQRDKARRSKQTKQGGIQKKGVRESRRKGGGRGESN